MLLFLKPFGFENIRLFFVKREDVTIVVSGIPHCAGTENRTNMVDWNVSSHDLHHYSLQRLKCYLQARETVVCSLVQSFSQTTAQNMQIFKSLHSRRKNWVPSTWAVENYLGFSKRQAGSTSPNSEDVSPNRKARAERERLSAHLRTYWHYREELTLSNGLLFRNDRENGPQYNCQEFINFSREWEFQHVTSSPAHPKWNGKSETTVQFTKRFLEKALKEMEIPGKHY